MDLAALWEYALADCHRLGGTALDRSLDFYRRAGPPERVSDREFFALLAETIVCTGLRGPVGGRVLARLQAVFCDWDVAAVARDSGAVQAAALAVFRHKGKVAALLTAALSLAAHPGIGPRLSRLSDQDVLRHLQSFPWIGATNSGWLARAMGIDAVTPDRYVQGLASTLGHDAVSLCRAVGAATGERPGVVDYVLWFWVDRAGAAARDAVRLFQGESA